MSRWPLRAEMVARLRDRELGRKVSTSSSRSLDKRQRIIDETLDWQGLRTLARQIKLHTLTHLDRYLVQFMDMLTGRGVRVVLAGTALEANEAILEAVGRAGLVIKAKSMTSEEIGVREALGAAGIRAVETDLGELIVQLEGSRPSHITAPAMHLSVEDIARIFRRHLGLAIPAELHDLDGSATQQERHQAAQALSLAARAHLRNIFLSADVGMTGANFLVAASGTVVLLENEANIRLVSTLPPRRVVLAGIEKLIPEDGDLMPFLSLLPPSATGQAMACYVSFIQDLGPGDTVVLLDNGRVDLLADEEHRDLLSCIRCGACMNICPVYRQVGGHAYGGAYPGPIGAALMPHLEGFDRYGDLPFASTLCGACTEVCPVAIPLHQRLVELRARVVEQGSARLWERAVDGLLWPMASWVLGDAKRLEALVGLLRKAPGLPGLSPQGAAWRSHHELPRPPAETFRAWWRRTRGSRE